MPEGDTIYRTAVNLRAAIEGRVVKSFRCRDRALAFESLMNQNVAGVEARGKHLLVNFENGQVLHSHMGMTGSWHLYRPDEPWRKPVRRAAISLQFEHIVAVCFSPKTLELLSSAAVRRHRQLRQLGPDILAKSVDEAEVLRRFRVHDQTPIGEALLNQTIICGIGNVYKSEVLFLTGINPFDALALLGEHDLRRMIGLARELMLKNLEGYPRRTRYAGDPQRLWVYGRQGEPCFGCATAIMMRRQGDAARSAFWCPACQLRKEAVGTLIKPFIHSSQTRPL